MKFYNPKRPVATTVFYVALLIACFTFAMFLKNFWGAVNFPVQTEVFVGKLPGRVIVNKSVPSGDYQIDVAWKDALKWGENAMTSISECCGNLSSLKKLTVKSSRPDKNIPGAYEMASTEIHVEAFSSLRLKPLSFKDEKLVLIRVINFEWVIVSLLALLLSSVFLYISHEVMKSEKGSRYHGM